MSSEAFEKGLTIRTAKSPPEKAPAPAPLVSVALQRLGSEWRMKLFLSIVLTAAFYAGYFCLQRISPVGSSVMAASAMDRAIPFDPRWAPVYLSLVLFIPVAPWLLGSKREVRAYCMALSMQMLVGFGVFLCWPTRCLRPPVTSDMGALFKILRKLDGDLNACPSFHAIFVVYTYLCSHYAFRLLGDRGWMRLAALLWACLILFATLSIKQHVAVDLLAGGILAFFGYALFLRLSGDRGLRGWASPAERSLP